MRVFLIVAVAMTGCAAPLQPGETRCTTNSGVFGHFGASTTDCQAYVEPAPTGTPEQLRAQESPEAKELRADRMRRVIEGDRPLECALAAANPSSGRCFVDKEKCDGFVAEQGAARYNVCEARNAGACFGVTVVLDGSKTTMCAPSVSDCEKRLAATRENPDFEIRTAQCAVYRFKPAAAASKEK